MRFITAIRRLALATSLAIVPSLAQAQNVTYEAVTFTDTVSTFTVTTITPLGRPEMVTCEGKLEEGQIRIRYDGTAPSDAEGALVDVGNILRIEGHSTLLAFRGIRTGGTSGVIRFHCTQVPQVTLTGSPASISGGTGGDGSVLDGEQPTIKATVFDYTSSNPVAVSVVDANGVIQAVSGGTQVTEDAAAAANPTGTLAMSRRRDTLSAVEVTTDLDVITLNATAKGELYVKQTDAVPITDNSGSITVDAASLPLPTGASTAAKQPALGTAGTASADVITVQGVASMTPILATLSGTNNINNIGGTISLPTGAATAAKQPALGTAGTANADVLTVQGIASMTPILSTLSGTNNIATVTAVTAITNALPAGANAIGKLAANSGVDIGDVDVQNFPTTASTSAVSVRCVNAAGNTFESCAGAGGSSGLTDTELRATAVPVSLATVPSHAVTNAGTFATQVDGAALTALQLIDNLPKTEDTGSADGDSGVVLLARRTAAPANTSGADLDYEALQMAAGRLYTSTTIDAALPAGANAIGTVAVSTSGLPTGASTAAKQPALGTAGTASNDVITVQGVASMTPLLATLSGTNNIATVSTVTAVTAITNALPAGTNAIGKLAANSGVDIGDVDVTSSVLPTGAATSANQTAELGYLDGVEDNQATQITALQLIDNLPKTEDTGSADGDTGVVLLARRTATPANTSGADLDYEALQMVAGRLYTSTTIDAALPAGTAAIGKLAANSGVDIGDVDVTSSALPTGAATSAKQPALGTAGTANADVITVQGIASMTPVLATLSGTNNIATVTTVTAVTAISNALPAGTNAIGKLAANSGVDIGDVDILSSALPSGASTSANQSTEITALQLIDNLPKTEDTGSADGDTGIVLLARRTASPANTSGADLDYEALQMAAGRLYTSATIDAALPAGTALIGQASIVATATTTNAALPYFLTSAATNNAQFIKASPGNVYNYHIINTTAIMYFLRMYNLTAAPTCSSATGFVKTIPIPASTSGAGIVIDISVGEAYSTGIAFCLTGGGSSTDNSSAATGVYINLDYK